MRSALSRGKIQKEQAHRLTEPVNLLFYGIAAQTAQKQSNNRMLKGRL
jgi:hypothetical protein